MWRFHPPSSPATTSLYAVTSPGERWTSLSSSAQSLAAAAERSFAQISTRQRPSVPSVVNLDAAAAERRACAASVVRRDVRLISVLSHTACQTKSEGHEYCYGLRQRPRVVYTQHSDSMSDRGARHGGGRDVAVQHTHTYWGSKTYRLTTRQVQDPVRV